MKIQNSKLVRRLARVLLTGVLLVTASLMAGAECYDYPNSSLSYLPGEHMFACAGTGTGCRHCVDYDQSGAYRSCVEDPNLGRRICVQNQDWPSNWEG